jgi:CubicO group peptidase (beta-lactamase class C family)
MYSPPSHSDAPPRVGRSARRRAAGAGLLAIAIALASCTASPGEERESISPPGLSARVTEYLAQYDEHEKVRAVLVFEDGESVVELYHGDDARDYLDLRSVTKSVVSTLIGIAIDEGLIAGVDSTLGELLPAYRGVMSEEVAAIPLDRVLTHTAGFAGGGNPATDDLNLSSSADWVGAIIADRVERGAGDGTFEYSSAGSHLLSAILDEATGGTVLEFARTQLFDPLGIDTEPAWVEMDTGSPEERAVIAEEYDAAGFAWPIDPQGIHAGWSFLKLRPEDLAKLGLLYLNRGVWEGESVVSSAWVEAATAAHVDTFRTPSGYGYQWWTEEEGGESMFLAVGYGGNLVVVVPDRGLVVVVASEFDETDALANAQKFDEGEAITLVQYVILGQAD